VVLHPLFLLAPQFMTMRSREGVADVSFLAPQPRSFSKTRVFDRLCNFAPPVVLSCSAGPAATERSPEGEAEWLPAAMASEPLSRVWAAAG
jgi:hypothetical protein